jgi:predicted nucleic acid-binding Zn finger protein
MKDFWERLREKGCLTPEARRRIEEVFGERGRKALRAVEEGRVKRYLDFYVVVGKSDEYVVEEDFCTCSDFVYRSRHCWHILAVRIAEATGEYEKYPLWYQDMWSNRGI